jgi:hypothetical protein
MRHILAGPEFRSGATIGRPGKTHPREVFAKVSFAWRHVRAVHDSQGFGMTPGMDD